MYSLLPLAVYFTIPCQMLVCIIQCHETNLKAHDVLLSFETTTKSKVCQLKYIILFLNIQKG